MALSDDGFARLQPGHRRILAFDDYTPWKSRLSGTRIVSWLRRKLQPGFPRIGAPQTLEICCCSARARSGASDFGLDGSISIGLQPIQSLRSTTHALAFRARPVDSPLVSRLFFVPTGAALWSLVGAGNAADRSASGTAGAAPVGRKSRNIVADFIGHCKDAGAAYRRSSNLRGAHVGLKLGPRSALFSKVRCESAHGSATGADGGNGLGFEHRSDKREHDNVTL